MSSTRASHLAALAVLCPKTLAAPALAGGSQTAYENFPEVPSGWFATRCCQGAIVADDLQVAPGTEGMRLSEITVRLLPYNGIDNLVLYVYEHDEDTGTPGEFLGSLGLPDVPENDEYVTVSFDVWSMGVRIPASGRLWVGLFIDAGTGGWNIANAEPSIGQTENLYARLPLDESDWDVNEPFPPDIDFINMMLRVEVVPEPCPADVNGDGVVDVVDMVSVILEWGCAGDCEADVNADGTVDIQDLVEVILSWGVCFPV
jgi:hypothetical protein